MSRLVKTQEEISVNSQYLLMVYHLAKECFVSEKHPFEMVVELTNNDFDNLGASLSEHKDDPSLLRNLVIDENSNASVILMDFKANLKLYVFNGEIHVNEIGTSMKEMLLEKYDFVYGKTKPPKFG